MEMMAAHGQTTAHGRAAGVEDCVRGEGGSNVCGKYTHQVSHSQQTMGRRGPPASLTNIWLYSCRGSQDCRNDGGSPN